MFIPQEELKTLAEFAEKAEAAGHIHQKWNKKLWLRIMGGLLCVGAVLILSSIPDALAQFVLGLAILIGAGIIIIRWEKLCHRVFILEWKTNMLTKMMMAGNFEGRAEEQINGREALPEDLR